MSESWGGAPPAPAAPPLPPPAWYPDPSGVGQLRYWNGGQWTPGVVIAGQVTERPMPWPPVGPPAAATAAPDERVVLPGRAVVYAVVGFICGIAGGIVLAIAGQAAGLPDIGVVLLNLAGLWTGLLGACWLASRRWGTGHVAHDYGLVIRRADVGWGLLMSLGARLAGAVVAVPFAFGPRELWDYEPETYGAVADSWPSLLVFAVIAVVGAPVVEELFFRGLLLRSLTTRLGIGLAVALQAVLFGMAHFSPLLGVANFTVVTVVSAAGIVFGLTAWWRRVGTSVVAHAAFNVVAVVAVALLNLL